MTVLIVVLAVVVIVARVASWRMERTERDLRWEHGYVTACSDVLDSHRSHLPDDVVQDVRRRMRRSAERREEVAPR